MPQLIKLPEVMKMTALSRSSIYAYIQKNQFPVPAKIGARAIAWKASDISAWIESRVSSAVSSNE